MTREELSFEAYVVLGNALHLLVTGMRGEEQQRLGLPMDDLRRLHAALEPVRANEMLGALEQLSQADRTLLAEAVGVCERVAEEQSEHLLGAPASVRDEVTRALLHPTQETGGLA